MKEAARQQQRCLHHAAHTRRWALACNTHTHEHTRTHTYTDIGTHAHTLYARLALTCHSLLSIGNLALSGCPLGMTPLRQWFDCMLSTGQTCHTGIHMQQTPLINMLKGCIGVQLGANWDARLPLCCLVVACCAAKMCARVCVCVCVASCTVMSVWNDSILAHSP